MKITEPYDGSNLARNGFVSGRDNNVFDHIHYLGHLLLLLLRLFRIVRQQQQT